MKTRILAGIAVCSFLPVEDCRRRLQGRDGATGGVPVGATAFGEMLPNHNNVVGIDTTLTDKWGLPVLEIDCGIG